MKITEVRVTLKNEDKLKGFANITFDDSFVIRGIKIIAGVKGFFVSMPSRRRPDGSYQDIAHPINADMRKTIEESVIEAYQHKIERRKGDKPMEQDEFDDV